MNSAKNTDARALIDRLGGSAELSRKTGYTVQRINNWKVRGIPADAKIRFPDLFWPSSGHSSKAAKQAA